MKQIKVYALPSHATKERVSGVDFARVIQPMKLLNGHTYKGYEFKVDLFDIHKQKEDNWIDISKAYDVVFLNYSVLDWAFASMGSRIRGEGKKMIMDIDDAIWYVRSDNPTYEQYHANNGRYIFNVECMLNEVDHITCSSRFLRNVIVDKTLRRMEHVTVLPNCIDLDLYNKVYEPSDREEFTILHFGSTTHFKDLLNPGFFEGISRVMADYPNVKFLTVGAFIHEFRYKFGQRYENAFGFDDIFEWIKNRFPKYMSRADIVVAPLEIDTYNRSKSFIKFLEYSSTKIPGVYQDIYQYGEIIEQGKNGYLASTSDEWYNSIVKLMDINERKRIGEEAYKTMKTYQIKDHLDDYAKVVLKTLDME